MNSQLTAFITLICTSGILNLYVGVNVFLKRHHYTDIAKVFMLYTASITIYCLASAFGLLATSLEQIKFWTIIIYVGMPISAPLGLLFIMQYLGIKLTKRKFIAFLFIPFITFLMVLTNDFHHVYYRVFKVDPVLGAPYIHQEIGPWYVVHGLYTFGSMFAAFLLVITRWKETAKVYRVQLLALLFGQFVPMLTAFLYLIGMTPPGVDPVPMVLWLSSILYLWSINSSRMFTLMPIAKDTIFNSIDDGVIVLDASHRIIEFNEACTRMFPQLDRSLLGVNIIKAWQEISVDPFPATLKEADASIEFPFNNQIYQVRTSPMQHPNHSGHLIIFTDITEIKRLQVKLEHLAYYDELTQILNRRAFFQQCEQQFAEAKNRDLPFTIILMDIDYFKLVNDTFGHPVGDQLLIHVVNVIQSELKETMLFARYGGEEFTIALKGTTLSEGKALANQLCRGIEDRPLEADGKVIPITASFGVAEAMDGLGETIYQLLNKADKALYLAKRNGRNQVQVYSGIERERLAHPIQI